MTKTYDQRCYDLAGIFLGDEDGASAWSPDKFSKMKHELALTIQESIEDWLASKRMRAAQAEINGNPDFLPGSCAHCGQFHSTAACPPKEAENGQFGVGA